MKFTSIKLLFATAVLTTGLGMNACKSKTSDSANNNDTPSYIQPSVDSTTPAGGMNSEPVPIATDDSLTTNVQDATKDYPGVTATVDNGEITLTGEITRAKLPKLMMALNSLHPKKINNNLTIQ